MSPDDGALRQQPRLGGALAASALVSAAVASLHLVVYSDSIIPLSYILPLLLAFWHRREWLLWVNAVVFGLLASAKMLWILPPYAVPGSELGQMLALHLINILLGSLTIQWVLRLQSRLHGQSQELRTVNEQLVREEATLESLLELSRPHVGEVDLLQQICRLAARLMGESVAAALVERRADRLVLHAQWGFGPDGPPAESMALYGSLTELVLEHDQTEAIEDAAHRPEVRLLSLDSEQRFAAAMASPLRIAGKAVGALHVLSEAPRPWSAEQTRLLVWLAGQCSRVWETLRLREDLSALNASLERRVVQRTDQLRRLATDLTLTEHRERRRLAQILHDELQQLLVSAKMRLSTLHKALGDRTGGPLGEIHDLLDDSIRVSRRLTTELSPPVLLEEDLTAAMRLQARKMHEKHGLEVEIQCQGPVRVADAAARILLFNAVGELLFNVVKHAGVRRAVVAVEQLADGRACVRVEDQGRGMDVQTAGRPTRDERFGLFSIRERLSMLGGQIELDSTPGGGTRATMIVPVAEDPSATRDRALDADVTRQRSRLPLIDVGPADGRIRLLLADDHKVIREGLIGLLDAFPDFQIIGEAADGLAAVEMACKLRPDVVVMDASMPRLNGAEATRQIRAALPHVKVIGLSMHDNLEMAQAMHRAGAAAYLTKGGPTEILVSAIRRLGEHHPQAQPARPAPADPTRRPGPCA